MKKKILIIPALLLLVIAGCKKSFLDTRPDGAILEEQLREAFDVAPEVGAIISNGQISGIYTYMYSYNTALRANGRHDDFGQKSIDLSTDLTAEDMVQTQHHWFGFDYLIDDRQSNFARVFTNWNFYYRIIFSCNLILGTIDLNTVTDPQLKAIAGQALSIRGWCYLNLAQLFQATYKGNETALGVPIYTSSSDLSSKGRGTLTDVYTQIESDLTTAIPLLTGWTRQSKEQINEAVAHGILARAYLNMERWADAATQAAAARQGLSLMTTTQYQDGFSDINNPEWMWGGDINDNTTTIFASFFSHMDNTSPGYAGALGVYKSISRKLYDQIPVTDVRKSVFNSPVTPQFGLPGYAQLKFVDPGAWVGDYVYMRVAEMYLIEAEARAMAGQEAQARQVLFDLISKRDPAYILSVNAGANLVNEIRTHRRIELWGEGFNLNDLRRWKIGIDRTGSNHRVDATLVIPAGDKRFFYQIPQAELDANINIPLTDQNP